MLETGLGQTLSRFAALTHFGGLDRGLEPNVDGTGVAVFWGVQIRQRLGVGFRTVECSSKRGKCVESDDPGRNAGCEVLRQKRSQRLILPTLQITRRPVVEQTEAEDMVLRFPQRNRSAERIA